MSSGSQISPPVSSPVPSLHAAAAEQNSQTKAKEKRTQAWQSSYSRQPNKIRRLCSTSDTTPDPGGGAARKYSEAQNRGAAAAQNSERRDLQGVDEGHLRGRRTGHRSRHEVRGHERRSSSDGKHDSEADGQG